MQNDFDYLCHIIQFLQIEHVRDSNPRTARDARATNDLKITAGGHFLVVTVMRYYTRGSHERGIKIVDPGSSFHRNESFKIL